ncbi:PolC-type DNA polymerase III [Clostridiaceae bacterium M8S5]|nr:PolC-type DNA polymerase III [Clostridiaceae bacterium M8S5]
MLLSELLEKLNIATNQQISRLIIDKVTFIKETRKLVITVKTDDIIDYQLFDNIKREICGSLNEYSSVEIQLINTKVFGQLSDLINSSIENIKYLLRKNMNHANVWIDMISWEVDHDTLSIKIDNQLALVNSNKIKIKQIIANMFADEFNRDLNVKVIGVSEENIKEHEEIRAKEEEKLVKNISIETNDNRDKVKKTENKSDNTKDDNIIYGKKTQDDLIKISEISSDSGRVTIRGEIFRLESRMLKDNKKKLYIFDVTDYTNSITVKVFANKTQQEVLDEKLKKGMGIITTGDSIYDTFSREIVLMAKHMKVCQFSSKINDLADEKRVELHLHSRMSDMDGITSFKDLAKQAKDWGHSAIAITDHGVVQSFPEALDASRKLGLKVLYGMEGYLLNDGMPSVINTKNQPIGCDYIVFDIETTGLSSINDRITEIGAVKISNNKIVDTYNVLVNPEKNIPLKIQELTGITNQMVSNQPTIEKVLPDFLEFAKGSVLVAHNANFDIGFIKQNCNRLNIEFDFTYLDTLQLSRLMLTELKTHKLNRLAKHFKVSLENHHRACDDAKATAEIFLKLLEKLQDEDVSMLEDINTVFNKEINYKTGRTYHIIIIAKNYVGLKNLYKLVSESHISYFYRKPRIPKSILTKYREGLILGTACEAGEFYKAVLENKSENELKKLMDFYDFLEIQPVGNNDFMIRQGLVKDKKELQDINKKIYDLGKKYKKLVVATGDVHFLEKKDEIFRRILMSGKGFDDSDNQPPLYFKTTDEMLKEFEYLGKDESHEVVVKNTNLIADMVEEILPIPDGTFPPILDGSDDELFNITNNKTKEIYGEQLPELVKKRLDRELNSIIQNGYAVLYIISQKLVKKSLDDGYLVGSRGSVGSSFVATMSGITEVNPLPPHYVCPKCKNSEFIEDGSYSSGVDMPDKNCPNCGTQYIKDGHDIPFETFLGFEGDKEPDIDLNFAGEYQPTAHHYVEELFGEGHVYRAGTIGTIAEKTAYGFVKKYFSERDMIINNAETNRLTLGCTGVKRTTGQHPGGVMVVPRDKDVHDFSPIQYPANDKKSGVITMHFDYHSISGRILKLDILGHDTPSIIRMLEDLTGENAQNISLDDKATMSIFTSTDVLGITEDDINCKVGTFGIPEFGTKFVRQMLLDTMPTTFDELVRISGLSHGTDVWLNNGQELVRAGTTTLKSVIATRDDIMTYLIYNGLEKKRAFTIMEKVRKGKGLTEDDENYMNEMEIPQWYIESCKKIKYMFPKAHAVAYVMMSFRIAYFKVHHPEAFYATYFTTKAVDFDAHLIVQGIEVVRDTISQLEEMGNSKTAKEKNLLTVLEVALEMYARGYKLKRVDLYKSDSDKFLLIDGFIVPPLKSLQGVGENAARNIVKERQKGEFISIEDLMNRAKVNKTSIEALRQHGCLEGMHEKNQLSLFNF